VPALLWDVQEEHLDEAEFACEAWSKAMDSPVFSLAEVLTGPEERLMAHVMGLVIGGEPVFRQLLRPVLDEDLDDDRYRTAAAALGLLDGAGRDAPDEVLAYLERAGPSGRWGLIRAIGLSRRTDLAARIIAELGGHQGPALSGRVEALTTLGVDVGRGLREYFKHGAVEVRRAAAFLARYSRSSKVLKRLVKLMMNAGDAHVRAAAIESALIRGLPGSWQLACQAAFEEPPRDPILRRQALVWVAMQGDADCHAKLIAALRARPDPDLLFAAGVCARPEAAALAIELVDEPKLARLAGELLSFVVGLPTRDERCWLDEGNYGAYGRAPDEALPALADDALDADLVPPDDRRLRLPAPAAVRAWWSTARTELRPDLRYYAGHPLEPRVVEYALASAPMRRRHPLALELAIRSGGLALLDTLAPARVQQQRCAEMFELLDQLRAEGRGSVDFQGGLPLV